MRGASAECPADAGVSTVITVTLLAPCSGGTASASAREASRSFRVPGDDGALADGRERPGEGERQHRTASVEHNLLGQLLGCGAVRAVAVELAEDGQVGESRPDDRLGDDVVVLAVRQPVPLAGEPRRLDLRVEQRLAALG